VAAPASSPVPAAHAAAWLHGPRVDLWIGAGLGYLLSVPLLLWLGSRYSVRDFPIEATLALGLLFSTPHYGATLLRVYERAEDRRRYRLFAVHASVAIAALFIAGLYVPLLGSLLITLYFAWSPWHFAGQNYGLSLMFLRRRGIAVPDAAKRSLYVAYLLSFAIALIAAQTYQGATFAPEFVADGRGYDVLVVGLPVWLSAPLAALLLGAFVACLVAAGSGLVRAGARAGDLVAPALLAASQAVWFVVPAHFASRGMLLEGLAFTAVWVSVAHSAQYLWVTSYYAKRGGAASRLVPYYGKALLAGCLIAVVPSLLLGPRLFGPLSWTGGLAILLFSVINLHHFVLDGAVWKLRDGRVARLLLRSDAPGFDAAAAPTGARWRAGLIFGAGALCLALLLVELWDAHAVRSRDVARLEAAARRLAWMGRERIGVLLQLGDLHVARGEPLEAESAYRRAIALRRDPRALNDLAWTLAVLKGDEASIQEGLLLAKEVVGRFGHRDAESLDTLAAAFAASGKYPEAVQVAEQALAHATAPELASPIAERLALYRAGRPYRPK
jgi:tetratricopeptide (TPR) repeat protein